MQATDLVLHWGVRKGKDAWLLPDKDVWPAESSAAGEQALETPFARSGDTVQADGKTVELQTLKVDLPASSSVKGLTFVVRSADGSAWFRDGGSLTGSLHHGMMPSVPP